MTRPATRGFWDRRARENALYFVDNRLRYERPDRDSFWAAGQADLDALLDAIGTALGPTDSVVEIGCGVGRLTRVIAWLGSAVELPDVRSAAADGGMRVTRVVGEGTQFCVVLARRVA